MPDDTENRTLIGVDRRAAWGARVRSAAPGAGTNMPAYIVPLACTGRNPGWTPPASESSTASRWVIRAVATTKTPEWGWGRFRVRPHDNRRGQGQPTARIRGPEFAFSRGIRRADR